MNVNRIQWLDALRGFGIILVTFAHLNPWYPLETHIYSFHMCLFFFISGYLFKQSSSLKNLIKKKVKNLLIPFIVWDFIASVVAILLGEGIQNTILRFFVIDGKLCWNAPIWFLLILFFVEIIYEIIMKISNSKKMIIYILVISVLLWILFGSNWVILKLNLVPLGIFFYGLGDFFHREFNDRKESNAILAILIVITAIINILFGTILNIRISYTGGNFGNIYFCIISAISGTILYWLIFKNCNYLGNNKMLCFLGKNSLIIMATQYCFFEVYDIFSQKLFNLSIWDIRSTIKALVMTIATIYFIVFGVSLFKKVFKNNSKVLGIAKYIGVR